MGLEFPFSLKVLIGSNLSLSKVFCDVFKLCYWFNFSSWIEARKDSNIALSSVRNQKGRILRPFCNKWMTLYFLIKEGRYFNKGNNECENTLGFRLVISTDSFKLHESDATKEKPRSQMIHYPYRQRRNTHVLNRSSIHNPTLKGINKIGWSFFLFNNPTLFLIDFFHFGSNCF